MVLVFDDTKGNMTETILLLKNIKIPTAYKQIQVHIDPHRNKDITFLKLLYISFFNTFTAVP